MTRRNEPPLRRYTPPQIVAEPHQSYLQCRPVVMAFEECVNVTG
jgi:hypothetical protein